MKILTNEDEDPRRISSNQSANEASLLVAIDSALWWVEKKNCGEGAGKYQEHETLSSAMVAIDEIPQQNHMNYATEESLERISAALQQLQHYL